MIVYGWIEEWLIGRDHDGGEGGEVGPECHGSWATHLDTGSVASGSQPAADYSTQCGLTPGAKYFSRAAFLPNS
jgi:hypothetical protein